MILVPLYHTTVTTMQLISIHSCVLLVYFVVLFNGCVFAVARQKNS